MIACVCNTCRGTGHHSQCDVPSVIPTWILRVFGMSANMDHNQSIELHRKLMTSYLYKYLGKCFVFYSTNKREHSSSILKTFFVRHSLEYETSDNDQKVNRNI